MTNGITQNRTYSSPSAFWRMEYSTIQLETRWTLHLGSVGGKKIFLSSLVVHPSSNHCSGRICPGKHIAHSTLTLVAASVLSTFDLTKKVDENGQEIEPKMEYSRAGVR